MWEGQGTHTFLNGDYTYKGFFKNNQRNGQGVLTGKNGSKYDGEWLKGKKHGKGLQIFARVVKYD